MLTYRLTYCIEEFDWQDGMESRTLKVEDHTVLGDALNWITYLRTFSGHAFELIGDPTIEFVWTDDTLNDDDFTWDETDSKVCVDCGITRCTDHGWDY